MKRLTPTLITTALLAVSAAAQPAEPENEQAAPPAAPPRMTIPASATTGIPAEVILPAGAWIKIRVDERLSSDRNQPGDRFSGTLTAPVVADGLVVAHRGQTIEGRVTEAMKAGRAKGTSRLGLELLEIGLADGQQLPVRTQMIEYGGGTSKGRDAAAIGTTTGAGAAIGAAAGGGMGAGIGALAGAAASTIGVFATRGRATEIYPETVVTFRTLEPVMVSTTRAPHAFQAVSQTDYEQRSVDRRPAPQPRPSLYSPSMYDPFFYGWGGPGWYGPGWYGRGWFGPRVIVRGGGGFRGPGRVYRRR